MSDPELRASFDEHAELYDRIRPTYPSEFVSQPRRLTDLGPGCRVAEIGRAPARLDEATRARKGCGRSGPGRRTGHRHDVSRFQRQQDFFSRAQDCYQRLLACIAALIDEDYGGSICKRYLCELRVARRAAA